MSEWIEGLPWLPAIGFMWLVAIVRSSLIYGLGRLAALGGNRFAPLRALMAHSLYRRAQAFVSRWGVLAIPACFLTLGFQTAVILTTGLTQMPLARWLPAMLVGSFIWGLIYATVGLSVIWLWLQNPLVGLGALLLLLALIFIIRAVESRFAPSNQPKELT